MSDAIVAELTTALLTDRARATSTGDLGAWRAGLESELLANIGAVWGVHGDAAKAWLEAAVQGAGDRDDALLRTVVKVRYAAMVGLLDTQTEDRPASA